MPDLLDGLFSTPAMAETFSPSSNIQAMLDFEAALARAQARAGIIPPEAAQAIGVSCRVELYDAAEIYRDASRAGTLAIPLVRVLTSKVEGAAKNHVHRGATSQDVIDTALMLQMSAGLGHLEVSLLSLGEACARLAEQHCLSLMAGRTLLQQALPVTFGLKAARWLSLVTRQVLALRSVRAGSLAVQLGGASGTQAALGDQALEVMDLLALELALPSPDLPWHTERSRVAEIAAALGITAGAMSKIAGDLALLAQNEVAEAVEGTAPGKGGSSAMPHKRNPVDTTFALSAARLAIGLVPVILGAMGQEHERGAGNWQAEWAAVPELFMYTSGAVERVRQAVDGLEVDTSRMLDNLGLNGGLIMAEALTTALSARMGRPDAFRLVEKLSKTVVSSGTNLSEVASQDVTVQANLSTEELSQALNPANYLSSNGTLIDRVLTAFHRL